MATRLQSAPRLIVATVLGLALSTPADAAIRPLGYHKPRKPAAVRPAPPKAARKQAVPVAEAVEPAKPAAAPTAVPIVASPPPVPEAPRVPMEQVVNSWAPYTYP
ncbi:hypothetical protein ABWL39_12365 [Chitinivorax sp. PXF-14]|uniref:hypothetical protein n=1 Tax=Chitinivorax sp. PXF-14 TaxID=3230488 RepID=UPI003467567F